MPTITITDKEFSELLHEKKTFLEKKITLPSMGEKIKYTLTGSRKQYYLDINRKGKIELSKYTIQNRYSVILHHTLILTVR